MPTPESQQRIPANQPVVLSDTEKRQIDTAISHTAQRSGASIDALKIVQQHRGWVSDASLAALAEYMQLSTADLDAVATFYNLIFRQPVGKVVLHPCDGISCDLMGGQQVRRCLGEKLQLKPGQTTDDGHFTLIPLPCLGACDKAPVMIASEQLFEHLNEALVPGILLRLAQDKSPAQSKTPAQESADE